MDLRPEAAEGVGVFLLVFLGVGAAASGAPPVAVALAFAFAVAALVYALGHLSGAHLNPAITLSFALTRHFPLARVPSYLAAQSAGAIAAAFLLRVAFGDAAALGVTAPAASAWSALAVEVVATFALALVIIGVATDARSAKGAAGLAIGLAVGAGAFLGASMNPARSLGPALAHARLGDLAIYVAGPLAGAALAMLAYEALRGGAKPAPRDETALGALGPVDALAKEEAQ